MVTSNADSGPGTLREQIMLSASNGSATNDIILFNLPDLSISGRTIVILSDYPELSSNLIIDASSQLGIKFGLSDAKVELYVSYSSGGTAQKFLKMYNLTNVKLYGLKINNKITWSWYTPAHGIDIKNSQNIEIGNIGKGNVIINWTQAIDINNVDGQYNKNISIYSNFFGLNENGETPEYNEHLINAVRIENLNIGNYDPLQGNVFACSRRRIQIGVTKGLLLIANNKIGTNYSGTVALSMPYGEANHYHDNIGIYGSPWFNEVEYLTDIKIINNLSTGITRGGIYIVGYGKKFYIQGNKIGTDITGTRTLSQYMDYGIWLQGCRSGIIGVENNEVAEKNIIAFAKWGSSGEFGGYGISVVSCPSGITISRNSIFCDQVKGIFITSGGAYFTPEVSVNAITANSIQGKAPPFSRIELFRDDSCINCEGKIFLDTTLADANGNWTKSNLNTQNIVVTATDTARMTSEFSSAKFVLSNFQIRDATCGRNNGRITGINIVSGTSWHWENSSGTIISTDSILTNVGPGNYRLVLGIGNNTCLTKSNFFEVRNVDPPASVTPVISPAACGLNNGSINCNYNAGILKAVWLNSLLDSIGIGNTHNNISPGIYYLKLSLLVDTSCKRVYGPFIVANLSGPTINTNNIQIASATCSNNNGSIRGLTASNVTSTPFIRWVDSLNNPVGSNLELLNVVPGKYRLKFKDGASCDTIITSFYLVGDIGSILIDTSQKIITPSKCSGNAGSIRQLSVTNGQNYVWINTTTNAVVGNTLDVYNLPTGNYQLNVSNSSGCSKSSGIIFVPQSVFAAIDVTGFALGNAICTQSNGFVHVQSYNNNAALYSFKWKDSISGLVIGTGNNLDNLGAATYLLFATDSNGCEKKIFSALVKYLPMPVVDHSQVKVTPDNCNLKQGGIVSLRVNNLAGPTIFTWYDMQNNIVGNSLNLQNTGSGKYVLRITDAGFCTIQSDTFTIVNNNNALSAPGYDDLVIPRFSAASLLLKNPAPGQYMLMTSVSGNSIVQQNTTGNFNINNIIADTTFYVHRSIGTCTSLPVRISIKVVDKSWFAIPTAFTPNGDGLNDRLNVKVLGYISLGHFKIYNKWGELVFQTNEINNGWDGRFKGALQNTGSYIWVVEGKDIRGNVITDKGMFTLIR